MGTGQSRDQRHSTSSASGMHSPGRLSLFSKSSNGNNGHRPLKEHKRHGVVTVRVSAMNNTRRNSEGQVNQVITPKGAILYGSLFNPAVIQNAIAQSQFPILTPGELPILDSRAHKLFVTYCQGWHIIPFPEVFSRHAGTCYVVGDRTTQGVPFQIKVGDCFRLGSVGLVVSEMKVEGEEEQRIDAKALQFLKDEALAFDTNEDLAMLASDEMQGEAGSVEGGGGPAGGEGVACGLSGFGDGDDTRLERDSTIDGESMMMMSTNGDSPEKGGSIGGKNGGAGGIGGGGVDDDENTFIMNQGQGLTNGEKYICYMCYETHNTPEDPLIAPCDCRGDTRFLHVQCLQRWYHSSSHGSHSQVIRTTGNGAPACKICGAAYKTNFRRHDGRKASILEMENDGPYLSLVVVTHHDTNPGLFNTKFRLNFGRRNNTPPAANPLSDADLNRIEIGRSSSCTMILDYRTVSTKHAEINYSNGKFYLSDKGSSNGTMVYIRDPLPLPYAKAMKIRMGRTTITLQARRAWTATMRSLLFGNGTSSSNRHNNGSNSGEDGNGPLAISANTNSTPTVSIDGGLAGGMGLALPAIFEPTPVDLQHFLATLHLTPGPYHVIGSNPNGNNANGANLTSATGAAGTSASANADNNKIDSPLERERERDEVLPLSPLSAHSQHPGHQMNYYPSSQQSYQSQMNFDPSAYNLHGATRFGSVLTNNSNANSSPQQQLPPTTGMQGRTQTIRTINDAGSVEGDGEGDDEGRGEGEGQRNRSTKGEREITLSTTMAQMNSGHAAGGGASVDDDEEGDYSTSVYQNSHGNRVRAAIAGHHNSVNNSGNISGNYSGNNSGSNSIYRRIGGGVGGDHVFDPSSLAEGDCTDLLEDFRSLSGMPEHHSLLQPQHTQPQTVSKGKEQPYSSGALNSSKYEQQTTQPVRQLGSSPTISCTPQHLVAGNSASIVVMNNLEDSCPHLLIPPTKEDLDNDLDLNEGSRQQHGNDGTTGAAGAAALDPEIADRIRRNSQQQKELQDNMFNSLPVAGVFAMPGSNSNSSLREREQREREREQREKEREREREREKEKERERRTPTPTMALSGNNSASSLGGGASSNSPVKEVLSSSSEHGKVSPRNVEGNLAERLINATTATALEAASSSSASQENVTVAKEA